MMKMLDFSDLCFYQSLFYIDNYLSHMIKEETTEKEIIYYVVGFFLSSSKFKESDIYEPSFDNFCSIKKKIYLSVERISQYEIKCLQIIGYNPFAYSAYDWINELISFGFVFDCEVNKNVDINIEIIFEDFKKDLGSFKDEYNVYYQMYNENDEAFGNITKFKVIFKNQE